MHAHWPRWLMNSVGKLSMVVHGRTTKGGINDQKDKSKPVVQTCFASKRSNHNGTNPLTSLSDNSSNSDTEVIHGGSSREVASVAVACDVVEHRFRKGVIQVLDVALPLVEGIPVAGTPMKAVIGGLLAALNALEASYTDSMELASPSLSSHIAEVHSQQLDRNKRDISSLRSRLKALDNHITNMPLVRPPFGHLRHELHRQLIETSTTLRGLCEVPNLQYTFVTQEIAQCSRDIDHYLLQYLVLGTMQLGHVVQGIESKLDAFWGTTPLFAPITGEIVTLVDATGRKHSITTDFTTSFQQFIKAVHILFDGDTLEARAQRELIETGVYDLCIDQAECSIEITSQENGWESVEAGTNITLRVVHETWEPSFLQKPDRSCPRCKMSNKHDGACFIDCGGCQGRFQVTKSKMAVNEFLSPCSYSNWYELMHPSNQQSVQDAADPRKNVLLFSNFHLKHTEIVIDSADAAAKVVAQIFGQSLPEVVDSEEAVRRVIDAIIRNAPYSFPFAYLQHKYCRTASAPSVLNAALAPADPHECVYTPN